MPREMLRHAVADGRTSAHAQSDFGHLLQDLCNKGPRKQSCHPHTSIEFRE